MNRVWKERARERRSHW